MRILDTSTFKIREFINPPKYAILSHTWGEGEVTFIDMEVGLLNKVWTGENFEAPGQQAGWRKVKVCCEQAVEDGFQYVWIDTCCIDKRNSTELAEAINAMFRWYQRAELCYVYLADVKGSCDLAETDASLARCKWLTRGWTLQELIGSSKIDFFDKHWVQVGTKESLKYPLCQITGIPTKVLENWEQIEFTSVAQRMSWAAHRETTRIEDRSYSLMGLFGVHMTMIYGEEKQAFQRLQLEILKNLPDQSIFAWRSDREACGLLAESPADFAESGSIRSKIYGELPPPIFMTEHGLRVTLPIRLKESSRSIAVGPNSQHYMYLNCYDMGRLDPGGAFYQVVLHAVCNDGRIKSQNRDEILQMVRFNCDLLDTASASKAIQFYKSERDNANKLPKDRVERTIYAKEHSNTARESIKKQYPRKAIAGIESPPPQQPGPAHHDEPHTPERPIADKVAADCYSCAKDCEKY
ncbi:uncharacterized protein PAC_15382 [Phialocephala subalpina]|uniref:Uncharacterized protein n=1 Tax=Phialocephala subalpina TaxID=576137 RepID=A0A1L7XKB2_9HELO|nr:uncharacterized protein PAC_15382 [Phialocephala subalpina]